MLAAMLGFDMSRKKQTKQGRPSKLTAEVREEICDYLREGNYLETAAAMVGVSKSVIYHWLKLGHKAKEAADQGKRVTVSNRKYVDFLDAVKKAEAHAEISAIRQLNAASAEAWQAICWRLERKHYDRWGRRQALEHSGPQGKPVKVQRVRIGDDVVEF